MQEKARKDGVVFLNNSFPAILRKKPQIAKWRELKRCRRLIINSLRIRQRHDQAVLFAKPSKISLELNRASFVRRTAGSFAKLGSSFDNYFLYSDQLKLVTP